MNSQTKCLSSELTLAGSGSRHIVVSCRMSDDPTQTIAKHCVSVARNAAGAVGISARNAAGNGASDSAGAAGEGVLDAGSDASSVASSVASSDAGSIASSVASSDAGSDAGSDASSVAGSDAGSIAGRSVLLICADSIAAARYQAIKELYDGGVDVLSVRELGLKFAANPSFEAAFGRPARLLDATEEDVLIEDLKVSGLKPKRLREMLKFFYHSMADLTSQKQGWLTTSEEQLIFAILEENLEARRAMLTHELSSAVLQTLDSGAITVPEQTYVVVDDFGALSASSQALVKRIATAGLTAVCYDSPATCSEEPYPCTDGGQALLSEYEDALSIECTVENAEFATQREVQIYASPKEEFTQVAVSVADAIAKGTQPSSILIAVPNGIWARHILAALNKHNVAAQTDFGAKKPSGDPRIAEKSGEIKKLAFAKLVRNPDDICALRSWVGLGDWLVASDSWLELLAWARDHKTDAARALSILHADASERENLRVFSKIETRLSELDELQTRLDKASAKEAAQAFVDAGMPLSDSERATLGSNDADANIDAFAEVVIARAEGAGAYASDSNGAAVDNVNTNAVNVAKAADANAKSATNAVTIAPYNRCRGRRMSILFFTGLVNGFLPKLDAVDDAHTIEHKKRAIDRDRALFDCICACSKDAVHMSLFTEDSLENTAHLDEQVTRIKVKDGERIARISPSEFIEA